MESREKVINNNISLFKVRVKDAFSEHFIQSQQSTCIINNINKQDDIFLLLKPQVVSQSLFIQVFHDPYKQHVIILKFIFCNFAIFRVKKFDKRWDDWKEDLGDFFFLVFVVDIHVDLGYDTH